MTHPTHRPNRCCRVCHSVNLFDNDASRLGNEPARAVVDKGRSINSIVVALYPEANGR